MCSRGAGTTHRAYWTVGTLVAFADAEPEPPTTSDTRAIWLTEIYDPCSENAEMNGDGAVDAGDLALFLDYYAKEAPQADLNGDKTVDSVDYLIYADAYAKR